MSEKSLTHNDHDPSYIESLQGYKLNRLKQNPSASFEELFSSKKMESDNFPDRPGARVAIDTPLEESHSPTSSVTQELLAILSLGEKTAVSVVAANDESGEKAYYLGLVTTNTPAEGRAKLLRRIKPGNQVDIGRDLLQSAAGRGDLYMGVSGSHCTIEIDKEDEGVLTVIDQESTNGTTVFTNNSRAPGAFMDTVGEWCQSAAESERLFEKDKEDKVRNLGRFTLDN